jgi:hypothetical protein
MEIKLAGLEMYRGSGISFVRHEDNVQIVEPFSCRVLRCFVDSNLSLCQKQTEVYIEPMEVLVSHADISLMTSLAMNWTKFKKLVRSADKGGGGEEPQNNPRSPRRSGLPHLAMTMAQPPPPPPPHEENTPSLERGGKGEDSYSIEFVGKKWGLSLEQEQVFFDVCFVLSFYTHPSRHHHQQECVLLLSSPAQPR